jgi:hypothetical protein
MKNDPVVTALINFLVPVIFLYSFFFLAEFFNDGFFAFVYSAALFLSGVTLLMLNSNFSKKIVTAYWVDLISFFSSVTLLAYLISVLLTITDFFSL